MLALLIGIVSGTYSSIFNASPLLVDWHLWDERRRRARARQAGKAAGTARLTTARRVSDAYVRDTDAVA